MKGTEKIIAHIEADAQAQSDAILAQAEQQCAQLREEYEKKAAELYSERIRAGVKAVQDQADSRQRLNQMEARRDILAVKQEMVARSFEKAMERLTALPEAEYVDFLASLAARAAVTGEEEIVLNARDRAAIGARVAEAANGKLKDGKLRLSEACGDFAGGLILRRGSIEANCTAELLVELCRGSMSSELAALLFEQ